MKYKLLIVVLLFAAAASLYFAFFAGTPTSQQSNIQNPQGVVPTSDVETLRKKVSSLLILHTPGTDPKQIADFVTKYQPAGIILMPDNIPNDLSKLSDLTRTAQEAATLPLFISIDQEGCTVSRMPNDKFPCAGDLTSTTATKNAFTQRSKNLSDHGINLNFGIVADITGNKDSFIYPRVFGEDPAIAGDHVAAAVAGSKPYTLSTIKHFPGHGQTDADSHTSVPVVTITKKAWKTNDAIPFQKGIAADPEFVMFSHLIYTDVDNNPATLSPTWHEILKKELGYKGLSITDDMVMLQKSKQPKYQDPADNAIAALRAGNDIVLFVNEYNLQKDPERKIDIERMIDKIVSAVQSGVIDEESLDAKIEKVNALRNQLSP